MDDLAFRGLENLGIRVILFHPSPHFFREQRGARVHRREDARGEAAVHLDVGQEVQL